MTKETSLTDEEIETIQATAFRQGMRRALMDIDPVAMANGWPEWSITRAKITVGFGLEPIDRIRTYDI